MYYKAYDLFAGALSGDKANEYALSPFTESYVGIVATTLSAEVLLPCEYSSQTDLTKRYVCGSET